VNPSPVADREFPVRCERATWYDCAAPTCWPARAWESYVPPWMVIGACARTVLMLARPMAKMGRVLRIIFVLCMRE